MRAVREYHYLPHSKGRVLRLDGDGLAYYYGTISDPGTAKMMLSNRIRESRRVSNADEAAVLLTSRGSHKGHRYAVATVKPYQGQRHGHRPANWEYLRDVMEGGRLDCDVMEAAEVEADDLFGMHTDPERDVILTQDKDMRMIPGLHMDWDTGRIVRVAPGDDFVWNDKQWGTLWFWQQVLHGDTADNIPGLPFRVAGEKKTRVGEKTSPKLLDGHPSKLLAVLDLYRTYYGDMAEVHLAEQAVLLWIRRGAGRWDDVFEPGHPLEALRFSDGYYAIQQRVLAADNYAQAEVQ